MFSNFGCMSLISQTKNVSLNVIKVMVQLMYQLMIAYGVGLQQVCERACLPWSPTVTVVSKTTRKDGMIN